MGGDGGVIASQRRFMRGAKSEETEKVDGQFHKENQQSRSSTCALSNEKLHYDPPGCIVACELGYLYNKEAIVRALLNKSLPEIFSHIRGLRDVKTLKFTPNPSADTSSMFPYACPITREVFNGISPFCFIWSTGDVVSEKAIRELGLSNVVAEVLSDQDITVTEIDMVHLLPDPSNDEMVAQKQHMAARRLRKKKSEEKVKHSKAVNNTLTESSATGTVFMNGSDDAGVSEDRLLSKDAATSTVSTSSSSSGVVTASSSSEVSTSSATSRKRAFREESLPNSIIAESNKEIARQKDSSQVFQGLFHSGDGGTRIKKDHSLFIGTAGMRYNIS